ncbi:hypothetical protein QBC40DRAFT_61470 [Triangularia verruculosa]|uniref:BHLH domain-containing protein n=1 Tax=Triangularia verruculosa TaxID=2587418 RepID=A0AAN6XNY8_9PEZI|nr:hypothetical protein QBC40DRAFT_61470 [Triangularia verruculosa]
MSHNHGFQMNGHGGNGGIDPNDLSNFGSSYQNNNFAGGHANANHVSNGFLGDDELLDSLTSPAPTDHQSGLHGSGQDFGGMENVGGMAFSHGIYGSSHHGLPIDNYSSTPDGDPMQSPYIHQFGQYRPMQHQQYMAVHSPLPYTQELNEPTDNTVLKSRPRIAHKPSVTRSPLTPTAAAMGLSIGSDSTSAFGPQAIRNPGVHHEKSRSGQWMGTPNSISSFPGSQSGFSSPIATGMHPQIDTLMMKHGTSMPAKIGAPASTAEAKKKKRRESHNLVERRRRDNINERIQDLSKLVPNHRLEDEKVRKAIQNGGTPMSPDSGTPGQATSSLAGGGRAAVRSTAGSITTGLPLEEKDKGPNKGDILNGSVGWMRDLMWLVGVKINQVEELSNALMAAGIKLPFEITEDEQRMQSEILDMASKVGAMSYSRTDGSSLRVPDFTDYAGKKLNSGNSATSGGYMPVSPNNGIGGHDMLDADDFLDYDDDDNDNGAFKEEAEFGRMDMS